MTKLFLSLPLAVAPAVALSLPTVGDVVGPNPAEATAALAAAGCTGEQFEAENTQIEAKCHDSNARHYEVYVEPRSGAVTRIQVED